MNKPQIVYSVLFCDCIYESSFATISLHRTKHGAVKAMQEFKKELFYESNWFSRFCAVKYGKQKIRE